MTPANVALILTIIIIGLLIYSATYANKIDIAIARRRFLRQKNKRTRVLEDQDIHDQIDVLTHEEHRRILRQIIKDLED